MFTLEVLEDREARDGWPWPGKGAQQQPHPARDFLAVFLPCHMGFWGVFFAASEPSPPRGLREP